LFIASDASLFTSNPQTKRQERYQTDLSFGCKDLAYLDSADGNQQWVRVRQPDNPRLDQGV
jgi:hypothetical protein